MASAWDIYQDHLDRVSRAVWDRDYPTVCACLGLPNSISTADASQRFRREQDLIRTTISFRDSLNRLGATGYHRICNAADLHDTDPPIISGKHTTYVLRSGQYALPPWNSRMTLELREGSWQGVQIESDVRNSDCTILCPTTLRRAPEDRAPGT